MGTVSDEYFIKKHRKYLKITSISYIFLWITIFSLAILISGFKMYLLINIGGFIIYFLQMDSESVRKIFTKKIYKTSLFSYGLALVGLGIIGIFLIDSEWGILSFPFIMGSPFIIGAIYNIRFYQSIVRKFSLPKNNRAMFFKCSNCGKSNAYTYNNSKELYDKDLACDNCGTNLMEDIDMILGNKKST